MMRELVEHLKDKNPTKKLYDYRFLEPCVGAGNFVFSYIKAVKATGINKENAKIMLDNLYVADVNTDALNGYKESLREISRVFWNIQLSEEYFEQHIGNGLLIDVTATEPVYIDINKIFPPEIVGNGFDIVVTNPPFKNLKAERGHYGNKEEYYRDKDKYSAISKIVKKRFRYSTEGILNLYKLFAEEIIDQYANETAFVSLLIPSSIMSDKMCTKLRTHILKDNKLISVKVIGEGSGYIDAQQALSSIFLQKGSKTDKVTIVKDYCKNPGDIAEVTINDILNENTGNAIVAVFSKEYQIVAVEFVNTTKKKCYIEQERIICQQIANMNKERRVTFALAPQNCVLGNSCNFISVGENPYGIDIYTLLGLFNTKIINWLFKLTSSNNHVNNYEIDCFPIPVEAPELKEISMLTRIFLNEQNDLVLEEIEELAYKAYGILAYRGEEK